MCHWGEIAAKGHIKLQKPGNESQNQDFVHLRKLKNLTSYLFIIRRGFLIFEEL